jgi:hypothetical protein
VLRLEQERAVGKIKRKEIDISRLMTAGSKHMCTKHLKGTRCRHASHKGRLILNQADPKAETFVLQNNGREFGIGQH